jgi:hypothetical protein
MSKDAELIQRDTGHRNLKTFLSRPNSKYIGTMLPGELAASFADEAYLAPGNAGRLANLRIYHGARVPVTHYEQNPAGTRRYRTFESQADVQQVPSNELQATAAEILGEWGYLIQNPLLSGLTTDTRLDFTAQSSRRVDSPTVYRTLAGRPLTREELLDLKSLSMKPIEWYAYIAGPSIGGLVLD